MWRSTLYRPIICRAEFRSNCNSVMTSLNRYTTEQAEENRKKPRFDPLHPTFIRPDEEEEQDEFEEDVGLSRAGTKRKQVRTDVFPPPFPELMFQGYDSDSSQEGDDKKKKKKAKTKKTEDEDDDMFADEQNEPVPENEAEEEEDDDLDAYGKLKKKKVNFVDYKTIEGQELSDSERERDIEDEEESVPSTPEDSGDEQSGKGLLDEEDVHELGLARSNQKIKMEKFNLRQEQTEGVFTEDGTFVRKAVDPRAHQDVWLDGLTKGAIQRAKAGLEKQQRREKEFEEKQARESRIPATERLERLIRALQPKETPLDALARLNTGKKKKWQPSQKWKKSKMVVDTESAVHDEEGVNNKEKIEEITAQADALLNMGNQTIYSTTRERLIMLYQEDTGERFRDEPVGKSGVIQWEYKWPGGEEVYSGYASSDMRSWKDGGFFGDGVLCRPVGSDGEWKSSTEIDF